VERSEEIRRVIDRYTRAIADADAESALGRLSEHPGTLIVGTDPGEWWRGSEIRAIWGRQIEELRGVFFVRADEIEAWEHGNVGWAAVRETISVEGRMLEARATYVLRLERGEWKVVQTHWSIPRANVEAFGRGLTVTIDELEEIVRSSRPDLSEALASDGTVTIVFTDIVDSTVVLGRLGDRAWLELLRRHDALIARATSAHGGTVVETQGDGSMLAFPSARRAVASAQAIQQEVSRTFGLDSPIGVRIGIHTGDALHEGDRFFGTTVHYAARVAAQALGGEILVSSVVHDLVADAGMRFHPSREVELKGLHGVHRLFALDLQPTQPATEATKSNTSPDPRSGDIPERSPTRLVRPSICSTADAGRNGHMLAPSGAAIPQHRR
jgi:class 3 adenylate cyclase/ketosteroid isomerase-like protein